MALTLAVAACGDSAASTTSAAPASTISVPATTAPATAPPPTSTVAPASTLPPVPPIVLRPDGLGVVGFGASPVEAAAAVAAVLGAGPTVDTGLIDPFSVYGTCGGTMLQVIEFESLTLLFTDAGYFGPEGTMTFFAWDYFDNPTGLATEAGVGIGSTVADLMVAYGADLELFDDEIFGPTFRYSPPGSGDFEVVSGSMTGVTGTDVVTFLAGGIGCGE